MEENQNYIRIELLEETGEPGGAVKPKSDYPLYRNCYIGALNAILNSFVHFEGERRMELGDADWHSRNNDYDSNSLYNLNHVHNIFAFVGGRGSGKTTAINDFIKILRSFERNKAAWLAYLPEGPAVMRCMDMRLHFNVLNPIDASVLEDKENLIELIWANMYEYYEKERKGLPPGDLCMEWEDRKRKLIREFDEVYTNYSMLNHSEDKDRLGDTVLARLKNMPSSLKIRSAFAELLDDYFRYMEGDGRTEQYLVVTIDDLDLNIANGYAMLEQLHKYLSHPRIVVLLAIDFKQMSLLCQNHFESAAGTAGNGMLYEQARARRPEQELSRYGQKLSYDYLMKVLPVNNRILMPDKQMLSQKAVIKVGLALAEQRYTVKQFILWKIAGKMGIYYDGKGVKHHFAIPRTVRELITYSTFLDSLFDVGKGSHVGGDRIHYYDLNYEQFNGDIITRMTYQLLSQEQKERLDRILERNLERRGQYAVSFCNEWNADSNCLHDNVDEQSYSYGDLLQAIYTLGRKNYENKVLVHCLLASFTCEMTREYYSYIYNDGAGEKQKRREGQKSLERLIKFAGISIGGKWIGDIISIIPPGEIGVLHGFIEDAHLNMGRLTHTICKLSPTVRQWSSERLVDKILKELSEQKIISLWKCILMLFTEFTEPGKGKKVRIPEIAFRLSGENNENELRLEINVNARACFDILGFIGKTLDREAGRNLLEGLKNGLISGLREFFKKYRGKVLNEPDLRKLVDAKVNSGWESLGLPLYQETEVAYPFYNFDLAYNVLKRVRRDCRDNLENRMLPEELCGQMRKVYGYVAEELYLEDQFYNKKEDGFAKKFVGCEFIRMFGIDFPQGEYVKAFPGGQQGELQKYHLDKYLQEIYQALKLNDDGETPE